MPDNKLKDNEIIKALECCKGADTDCWECELFDSCKFTVQEIMQNALNLINSLQEKIKFAENINHLQMEELQSLKDKNKVLSNELAKSLQDAEYKQAENERLRDFATAKCEDCAGCTSWKCDCANIKAEAYKEVFEKLNEKANVRKVKMLGGLHSVKVVTLHDINTLKKELVGEDNPRNIDKQN